jgi:threonine 3-dehydrogenase
MIYIDDCIQATIDLLNADNAKLTRRVYNLAGISFSPEQIAAAVKKYIPDFTIEYAPDFRQAIAETWPRSLDDSESKNDWGWTYDISLNELAKQTIKKIDPKYKTHRKIVGI